jgi:hypothetical protein
VVRSPLVLIGRDDDECGFMIRRIGVCGEVIMAVQCLVGVSVLCTMTDPAFQSNGQPYSATPSWGFKGFPNRIIHFLHCLTESHLGAILYTS